MNVDYSAISMAKKKLCSFYATNKVKTILYNLIDSQFISPTKKKNSHQLLIHILLWTKLIDFHSNKKKTTNVYAEIL